MLDAALGYEKRGWSVIPLKPKTKLPLLVSWKDFQKKRLSPADIRGFWSDTPDANIGVVTGKISGITVVDLDGPHAADLLKQHGLTPPKTLTVKTPHGYHVYLAYDPSLKQGAAFLTAECECEKKCQIDVRNDGGYVVAPPSVL